MPSETFRVGAAPAFGADAREIDLARLDPIRLAHHTEGRVPFEDPNKNTGLPNLHITAQEFGQLSQDAFNRIDLNGDGKLTDDELGRALQYRLTTDTDKTMSAIKRMYDNYAFLLDLSPQGWLSNGANGITRAGLDLATGIATGALDHNDYTLNRTHRRNWAEGMGVGFGWLTGIVGAGIAGVGTAEMLGLGSGILGLTVGSIAAVGGLAAGVAVPLGVGYGIGYGRDVLYARKHQERDVNRFLLALDLTPRSSLHR